jgi:hypothetical protein
VTNVPDVAASAAMPEPGHLIHYPIRLPGFDGPLGANRALVILPEIEEERYGELFILCEVTQNEKQSFL